MVLTFSLDNSDGRSSALKSVGVELGSSDVTEFVRLSRRKRSGGGGSGRRRFWGVLGSHLRRVVGVNVEKLPLGRVAVMGGFVLAGGARGSAAGEGAPSKVKIWGLDDNIGNDPVVNALIEGLITKAQKAAVR